MNADLQAEIDGANVSVRSKTKTATKPEGYTALDLCKRVVTKTGKKSNDGYDLTKTEYILNWPDTVIPPVETCENNCSIAEAEDAAAQDAIEAQADNYEAAERMYAESRAEEAE